MIALSAWHRAYLNFLLARGVPLGKAIELTESTPESPEDPVIVAQRNILEDLSSEL